MAISVRGAAEGDAGSIVDLLNPIVRAGTYSILGETFTVDDQIAFIRDFPERGVYLVAVEDGAPGVLGIQDVLPASPGPLDHVGEISTFVALDAHRQGVGRALTEAMVVRARARGFRKIMATVRADNPGAVAFYASQGFRVIGTAERHARVRGRDVDEVLMERLLLHEDPQGQSAP